MLFSPENQEIFQQYQRFYYEFDDAPDDYEDFNDFGEFDFDEFYFDGDDLKMLKVEDASTKSVQYTYFDEISFDVDNSYFRIPTGAFDATPFLAGIILAIIAAA